MIGSGMQVYGKNQEEIIAMNLRGETATSRSKQNETLSVQRTRFVLRKKIVTVF
jgi:hypothetical protein